MQTNFPKILITVSILAMSATLAFSQEEKAKKIGRHNPINDTNKWGVEVMVPGFAANAYIVQFTRTLWNNSKMRGDALLGTFNWIDQETPITKSAKDPKTGNINIHTFPIGYRQYIWKGLNVELQGAPGFETKKEEITDKSFNGFRFGLDFVTAYKFDFNIKKLPLYVVAAANFHLYTYQSNPLPNASKTPSEFGIYPLIWLGARF